MIGLREICTELVFHVQVKSLAVHQRGIRYYTARHCHAKKQVVSTACPKISVDNYFIGSGLYGKIRMTFKALACLELFVILMQSVRGLAL